MNRLLTACRLFFRVLGSGSLAEDANRLLAGPSAQTETEQAAVEEPRTPATPPEPPRPVRSDAVTLLATLQREARFVDFIGESLDGYSDQQVAGAVRDVHRHCAAVLERLFDLRPVTTADEGTTVPLENQVELGRFRLTGHVTDTPPASGTLVHHGWEAGKCELPEWTGHEAAALVVAPAEIEVQG